MSFTTQVISGSKVNVRARRRKKKSSPLWRQVRWPEARQAKTPSCPLPKWNQTRGRGSVSPLMWFASRFSCSFCFLLLRLTRASEGTVSTLTAGALLFGGLVIFFCKQDVKQPLLCIVTERAEFVIWLVSFVKLFPSINWGDWCGTSVAFLYGMCCVFPSSSSPSCGGWGNSIEKIWYKRPKTHFWLVSLLQKEKKVEKLFRVIPYPEG